MAAPKNETQDSGGSAKPKPPIQLIVVLLNTVVLIAGVGTLAYTKLIFKRPKITESAEREKLEQAAKKPKAATESAVISLDSISVNVSPTVIKGQPEETSPALRNKLHYVTLGVAVEFSDVNQQPVIEEMKPFLTDQIISLVGKQDFFELNTVHGRYLLRSQIIEAANELLKKTIKKTDVVVTNIYFNEFMLK